MRAVFTLEILQRVQRLLRDRYDNPKLVLADYFNFIGGTSTGAIIAGLLSWGRSVEEIKALLEQGHGHGTAFLTWVGLFLALFCIPVALLGSFWPGLRSPFWLSVLILSFVVISLEKYAKRTRSVSERRAQRGNRRPLEQEVSMIGDK
jgi:Patatin-like phospholipase